MSKPFSSYFNQGVIVGESTEIPFTQDAFDKIIDLHNRLGDLCKILSEICGTPDAVMALVEGKLGLLLGS
jgi:hypothetical protein